MSSIEQYGDLSESELFEFLHIIEADDDDIAEAEQVAERNIAEQDECLPDEMLDDQAWVATKRWEKIGEDKYVLAGFDFHLKSEIDELNKQRAKEGREKGIAAMLASNAEYVRLRKQRKISIQRAAFNQSDIYLSNVMPKEAFTSLIKSLTDEHRAIMGKLHEYINRRLTVLLKPLIPRIVKTCAERYPQTMQHSPGFMYKASNEYGSGKCFWATPDIPYFFIQGTEQDVLKKNKPEFLFRIDKAVAQYFYHDSVLAQKEVKFASVLISNNIKTYFDLLKYNPFWFEKVYVIQTNKPLIE